MMTMMTMIFIFPALKAVQYMRRMDDRFDDSHCKRIASDSSTDSIDALAEVPFLANKPEG